MLLKSEPRLIGLTRPRKFILDIYHPGAARSSLSSNFNAEKLSSISATRSRRSGKVWKTEIVSPKCRNGQLGGERGEGGGEVKGEEEGNLNGDRERFWQRFLAGGGNIRKEKDPIVLKAAPESGSNLLPVRL